MFCHQSPVTGVRPPSNRPKKHAAVYCDLTAYRIAPKFGQKLYLWKIYVLCVGIFLLSNGCYGNQGKSEENLIFYLALPDPTEIFTWPFNSSEKKNMTLP